MSPFDTLSAEQREVAHTALEKAFGRTPVDAVVQITAGASTASVFRVEVRGQPYVLRVEGDPSPLRNPHQYVSMRIAADAGIAPPIRYLDETARVAIIDFIAHQPLSAWSGGPRALARALGDLLARVQATPAFPYFVDYPDIVSRLFAHICRTGLFAPGVLDAHAERLARICDAWDRDPARLVSSHNDSIPNNILFDGTRLWMIDWESAYRNDPLVDVAIMLDYAVRKPELQNVFVEAWRGCKPDDTVYTQLTPARALTRLYYAGVLLSASAAASWKTGDTDLSAPSPDEFGMAIRDGKLALGTPQTNHITGKMFLAWFLSGALPPRIGPAA